MLRDVQLVYDDMIFSNFFPLIAVKVATLVAENIELHKSKLKFFMQKFCAIIRTMESTNKELSIAIRGYGLFAAVGIWTFYENSKYSL